MDLLSRLPLSLPFICVMTFGFQFAALWIIGRPTAVPAMSAPPKWDLPLRMGIAVAFVLSITGFAALLGPKWSGLLAPFPAFTLIMTAFSHQQHGVAAAHLLLYGVVSGALGAIGFFCVVAFGLTSLGTIATFTLAVLAALAVNGLILAIMLRGRRG
jgi:hypothetical protein